LIASERHPAALTDIMIANPAEAEIHTRRMST
jgi:hypothetical protein